MAGTVRERWRRRKAARGSRLAIGGGALLALALLAASCGGAPNAVGRSGSSASTTGTGSPAPSSTTTSSAPPTTTPVLTAGQQGSRASVPWSQVGAGWLLATWSTSPAVGAGAVTPPQTLFLLDPQGGRYSLGSAPKTGVLTDWSGSGTDALFLVPTTPAATGTIGYGAVVVNLRTGTTTRFSVGAEVAMDGVQFAKPEGTAVVVSGPQVRRYGLTGGLEESYPTSIPGAAGSTTTGGAFVETPTGAELGLSGSGGIDVMSNGGKALRFLGPPPGDGQCIVDGLWQATSVLESCGAQLWAQPLSGGAPVRVASSSTGTTLIDAWMVGTQVVAEAGACGTTWLEAANPGGTLSTVTVPDVSAGGSVQPVGAQGAQLAAVLRPGCDGGSSGQQDTTLAWYDPGSNVVTPLLGGLAEGGTVDAAVLFHGPTAGGGAQDAGS